MANDDTAFYEELCNYGGGGTSGAKANGGEEDDATTDAGGGTTGVNIISVSSGSLTLGKQRSGKASMIAEEGECPSLPAVTKNSSSSNMSNRSLLNTPKNAGTTSTMVTTPGGTVLSPLSSSPGSCGNSFRSFCRNSLIAHSHSVKGSGDDGDNNKPRVRSTTIGFANNISISSFSSASKRHRGAAGNDDDADDQRPRPSSSMDSILAGSVGPGGRILNKGLSIILDSPENDGGTKEGSRLEEPAKRISREVKDTDDDDDLDDTFSLNGMNDRAVSASLKTVAKFKRLNSGHRLSEAPAPPPKRITLKLKKELSEKAAENAAQESVGTITG